MHLATLCRMALLGTVLCTGGVVRAQQEGTGAASVDFRSTLARAVNSFNTRDFRAALTQCDTLDKIQPETAVVLNMRGAIALEERRFQDGETFCKKALDVDPRFFPARFNLAEIPFLQKRYTEARDIYERLLAEDPKNELLQYRLFLTYLLEGNEEAADGALKKVKFPGDTAAYYYGHAAWEFQHGNIPEAEGWIKSGDWVFSKAKNIYFIDVFYDLGWLKRPANSTNSTTAELKQG